MKCLVSMTNGDTFYIKDMPDEDALDLVADLEWLELPNADDDFDDPEDQPEDQLGGASVTYLPFSPAPSQTLTFTLDRGFWFWKHTEVVHVMRDQVSSITLS